MGLIFFVIHAGARVNATIYHPVIAEPWPEQTLIFIYLPFPPRASGHRVNGR